MRDLKWQVLRNMLFLLFTLAAASRASVPIESVRLSSLGSFTYGYDEANGIPCVGTTIHSNSGLCQLGLLPQQNGVQPARRIHCRHAGCGCEFTGKERDAETGLDYFLARYLSSAQGRFTSPDAPFADQHVAEPQTWNLYSYARNNPLLYVDDTGRGAIKHLKRFGKAVVKGENIVGKYAEDVQAGVTLLSPNSSLFDRGKALVHLGKNYLPGISGRS